jgi:hypothetical protein
MTAAGSSGTPGAGASGGPNGSGGNSTAGATGVPGAGTAGMAGGATGGVPTCAPSEGLQVTRLATTSIAQMGEPFDSNAEDTAPWEHDTNYGKPPEIVAVPDGEHVDVLWQDHSGDVGRNEDDPNKNAKKAFVVRIEKGAAGYALTRAYQIDQLAHIMGLTKDELGNYYVATGVDEDQEVEGMNGPADGMHRPGIVKLVKFDVNGCKSLEIDVSGAREMDDPESEPIINPMVAATSRLAYQGGQLALLHGINTDYDPGVDSRHQKALTTHLDAMTGLVTRDSTMWVSHSFDQRLFWDGSGFVELHLGDAYPRSIALGRFTASDETETYDLFKAKGELGDNNTFTRLGGIAPIATGDLGYLVVFTTERGTETAEILNGTRDLAFLRVARGFADMDESGTTFVDGASTQAVTSSGEAVTNKLSWLTDYAAETAQADRSRVAAIGGDQFVVLWERWTGTDDDNEFTGTYGLLLGGDGMVKLAAKQVTMQHLLRSDDVVTLGTSALLVTGDGTAKKLTLNLVGADLAVQAFEIP